MDHKSSLRRLVILAALVLLVAPASGQTFGVPFLNDLYVGFFPGALAGPPGGFPCVAPPFAVPAGVPFTLNVTAAAPGMLVIMLVDLGPCAGGFVCLPPIAGPYAAIPLCLAPCGPGTNQSVDIPFTATPVLVGYTTPAPPGSPAGTGIFTSPVLATPGLGLVVSVQAILFDPAFGGLIFGSVVTNAATLLI